MLISPMAPALPQAYSGIGATAALCPTSDGLSGDPFGITDVVGIVSNYINARKQEKIQKEQIGLERSALKQQKLVDAQTFAAEQAVARLAPNEAARKNQEMALYAVGGAAVIITAILIIGAVKK